jgi:hypothetical protein
MKAWYLIFFCTIFFIECGRFSIVPERERAIIQVFHVQLPRDEIYNRALEWCAKRYIGSDESVTVKDKERGVIICKGKAKYSEYFNFLVDRPFRYSLTVEVKENRYRVSFDHFIVYYEERDHRSGPAKYSFEIGKIRKVLLKDTDSLRDYIVRGASGKEEKGEEW